MAMEINGKIHKIFPVETNEYNGNMFSKQNVVLNCTTYDQYTGEPRPNFPQIEFSGRALESISGLNTGDVVEVSFFLSGRQYNDKQTGEEKYFTSIRGYKIELHETKPRTNAAFPSAPPMPTREPAFTLNESGSSEGIEPLPF